MNSTNLESLIELSKVRDFIGIYRLLDEAPTIEKGGLFEQYLEFLYKGNGWLVKSNAGRNDKGADLLLYHPESPDKATFVIQAKNHKSPLTVDDTKIELIKFEDQASENYQCHNYKLISINGFVKEAKKLESFNMALFDFDKVKSLVNNYKENNTTPSLELAAHNLLTSNEVRLKFKEVDRIAVVQATGTGKSYIIGQAIINAMPNPCVILAPSHFILKNQKKLLPWRSDVSYITYAKAAKMSVKQWMAIDPSLIVLDEFHRAGADIWGEGVERLITSCPKAKVLGTTATPVRHLDNERNMVEEIFDKNLINELSLYEAIAKNILPSPKYVSGIYSFDEMNEKYEIAINNSRMSNDEKAKGLADLNKIHVDWEASSGIPNILDKHLKELSGKYIVFCEDIDHLDEMQDEVSKWFRLASKKRKKVIKRYSYLVHSQSSITDNEAELSAFDSAKGASGVHILLSVNMLNEGLHIKQVNGVILLRKTASPIIYLQQLGRCLQVSSEVDPIVFDLVNNINNLGTTSFQSGLNNAITSENEMRSAVGLKPNRVQVDIHDEVLDISRALEMMSSLINLGVCDFDDWFEKLEEYIKSFGDARPLVTYKTKDGYTLGAWVNRIRTIKKENHTKDQVLQLESLKGWVWDVNKFAWDEGFDALKNYLAEAGHARPPQSNKTESGYRLGSWVMVQRSKKERLTVKQIAQLESLEGWTWDVKKFLWEQGIENIEKYITEFGDARPPFEYKTKDGYALGKWVDKRRSRKDNLTNAQVSQLESLEGWVWSMREYIWAQGVDALKKYLAEFGNARPHFAYKTKNGYKLGAWVMKRRSLKGKLTITQISQLESLDGWVWNIDEFLWNEGLEALKNYVEEFGDARPSQPYQTKSGYKLGAWVRSVRSRKKTLMADKISELESLKGWTWHVRKFLWDQSIEALVNYITEVGHARPPHSYKTKSGYKLGLWVVTLRARKKELTTGQISQLESLEGWVWNLLEQ